MHGPHDESALGGGIRNWTDDWLFTDPGGIFSYSNPGYWMAGYVLEVLSGKSYADAMEGRLFGPIGMVHTTLRPLVAMTWPLAQGHAESPNGSPAVVRPAADNAASWPAGSVFSNVQDLSRFVIAFLNGGKLDGKQVLDPKVIALLSSPHAQLPGSTDSYGYGLILSYTRGIRMLEHGGSRAGYGSTIRMAPDERVGVIVLANRSGVTMSATAMKALEILLPLQPRAAAAIKPVLETTAEDIRRHVGNYRNGDERIEISVSEGRLFVKRGGRTAPLVKRSVVRYEVESGSSYVLVEGDDGNTRYVNAGSRSFSRIR